MPGFSLRIRLVSLHWWGERMVSRRVGFAHHPKAIPLNKFGGGQSLLRDGEPRRPPMRRHEPRIKFGFVSGGLDIVDQQCRRRLTLGSSQEHAKFSKSRSSCRKACSPAPNRLTSPSRFVQLSARRTPPHERHDVIGSSFITIENQRPPVLLSRFMSVCYHGIHSRQLKRKKIKQRAGLDAAPTRSTTRRSLSIAGSRGGRG